MRDCPGLLFFFCGLFVIMKVFFTLQGMNYLQEMDFP